MVQRWFRDQPASEISPGAFGSHCPVQCCWCARVPGAVVVSTHAAAVTQRAGVGPATPPATAADGWHAHCRRHGSVCQRYRCNTQQHQTTALEQQQQPSLSAAWHARLRQPQHGAHVARSPPHTPLSGNKEEWTRRARKNTPTNARIYDTQPATRRSHARERPPPSLKPLRSAAQPRLRIEYMHRGDDANKQTHRPAIMTKHDKLSNNCCTRVCGDAARDTQQRVTVQQLGALAASCRPRWLLPTRRPAPRDAGAGSPAA